MSRAIIVLNMTGPFADRMFRIAFFVAGCYNLAFGIWAGIWPQAFFDLFQIKPPRYPGIWACLGMVVGVYGLLYWHAASRLDTAWPIIAVGLLGKVLGPLGMALSFGDDWPLRLGLLCVYNDLIWWLPFGLFLVRGTALGRGLARSAPWLCIVMHVLALAIMLAGLRPGTLAEANVATRGAYIANHAIIWAAGWGAWMVAAMSLMGFYAWWGSQLPARTIGMSAVLIAAAGMVCDFSGESISALLLVERAAPLAVASSPTAWDAASFVRGERAATLLTAGAANGFYTLGGLLLTLATPDLPRWVRHVMWGTWLAGLAMTVAAVIGHVGGMVAATLVLFPLFIGWTAWMGTRWRPV